MLKKSNTVQALWLIIGSFSSLMLSILSSAILSRYLTKSDYGTFKQVMYVYNTLLVVFTAGLPRVFSYYLPKYSLEEGKSIVLKLTKILFFSGILFSLTLFFGAEIIAWALKNPDLAYNLKVFSPIPAFLLPTLGIDGIFASYKKTHFIAIYNITTRLLMLCFIVLPVIFFNGNCTTAIYGWSIVSLFTFFIALFIKNIPFKGIKSIENDLTIKEMLVYSLPIVYSSLWGTAIKSADQFYISRFFGTETFAEYSNGFIEIPLVSMITSATSAVMMPVLAKMIHDKTSSSEITNVWQNTLMKSALIIYPIVVFCIFFSKDIMLILYSNKYSNSSIYFQFSMLLNLFNIIIFAPILFAMGETNFYAKMHQYSAICVWGLGFLIVSVFHSPVYYAIFSTVMACSRVIAALIFISKKLDTALVNLFPLKICLKIILQTVIILLLLQLLIKNSYFNNQNIIYVLVNLILYCIIVLFSAKFFKIDYWIVLSPLFSKIKKNV